jgi:hypothetical protein
MPGSSSLTSRRHGALAAVAYAAALSLLLLLASVLAQEDLYGPQAPVDVAYVRAVNAVDPGGLGVRVADADLVVLPLAGATAYVAVSPGLVRVDLGGETAEIEASLGAFLTVVARPDGVIVIEDVPLRDTTRGILALYNLSEHAWLALEVIDGPSVVERVEPGAQEAVVISEASVALRVVSERGEVIDLEARLLERGVAHAVIVTDGPEGLTVAYAASRLDH